MLAAAASARHAAHQQLADVNLVDYVVDLCSACMCLLAHKLFYLAMLGAPLATNMQQRDTGTAYATKLMHSHSCYRLYCNDTCQVGCCLFRSEVDGIGDACVVNVNPTHACIAD